MTDLNNLVICGRITRDLDERSFGYVSNGNARAMLSVAVNRSKKVGDNWEDEVSFFDVTVWGKTAENLKPYLTKGKQILIKGYLKQDRFEKDGEKKSRVSIVAENVYLMGGRDKDPNGDNPNTIQAAANPNAAVNAVAQAFNGEIVSGSFIDDPEIPF